MRSCWDEGHGVRNESNKEMQADAKAGTRRKTTTQRLKDSELKYRRLFEAAQDGILILDSKTAQIIDVNPFLIEMLGYSRKEFLGKRLWEVGSFKNVQIAKSAFTELQRQGYIRYEDMPLETKNGHLINVEFVSNIYLVDAATEVIQCNIRDITERRQAEDALKENQQQQLQIRDEFLSRMSHELRSPLTPIHQFVTILLDRLAGDLNAEQREYLLIILRSVNALRTMVSDLLEVTRAESGKLNVDLRCVYLAELIPQIMKKFQLANTKDLVVSFDVPDNLPPVCADPDRVRQILDNLLNNAIKFSPEKGEVHVQARISNRNDGFLRISVIDNGHGIAPSEQEKIFEYLYQIKDKNEINKTGFGIGLYICKELVSSHGGRIWVKSRPGHGSTFSFTLPVFSLERQLDSIVKAADLITHSIALITFEISHNGKHPLKRKPDEAALRDAWGVLQSCVLPNLVVLLPRVPHTMSKEFFFIVACVNQDSAQVLVEQLHHKLARCQSFQDSGLNPEVSFVLRDTRLTGDGILSKENVNKKVVDDIEDLMKTTLHNNGGLYERTKSSHSG
jgi:PAS domain S-box-containing protein